MPVAIERKPLTHSERGRLGAAAKWSDPFHRTTVRIADLSLEQRAIVLALIDAAKKAPAAAESASAQEVDRHARDHTTARAS